MTRLDEWALQFSNTPEIFDFVQFIQDELATTQCKEVVAIADQEELLQYLLYAFGCYSISHKRGVPHLIRNPEALSLTPEQQKQLIDLVRETIVSEIELAKAKKAAIKRPNSK